MDKTWANFKIFFALEYNELREEQRLNTTQAGFQHANNYSEEQKDFVSAPENLEISVLSNNDAIAQLIA